MKVNTLASTLVLGRAALATRTSSSLLWAGRAKEAVASKPRSISFDHGCHVWRTVFCTEMTLLVKGDMLGKCKR